MNFPDLHQDLREYHREIRSEVLRILQQEVRDLGPIKVKLEVVLKLRKVVAEDDVRIDYFTVQRNPILLNIYNEQEVVRRLNKVLEEQLEALAEHNDRGSGWAVEGIEKSYIGISRYNPVRGGSYIPLPKFREKKNAVINVKNKDNQCLRWAIKAAKFPVQQNAERPSKN